MSIYRRTIQGRMEAFNSQSSLPKGLRQLLQCVDGKTDFLHLQNRLGKQACSDDMLKELVQLDLVSVFDPEAQDSQNSGWRNSVVPSSAPEQLTQPSGLLSQYGGLENQPMPFGALKTAADRLADVKAGMEDFVLAHMPERAFEILREIESITSAELLLNALPSYESSANLMGLSGKRHLEDLLKKVQTL
jgi:hypothetical protein